MYRTLYEDVNVIAAADEIDAYISVKHFMFMKFSDIMFWICLIF